MSFLLWTEHNICQHLLSATSTGISQQHSNHEFIVTDDVVITKKVAVLSVYPWCTGGGVVVGWSGVRCVGGTLDGCANRPKQM